MQYGEESSSSDLMKDSLHHNAFLQCSSIKAYNFIRVWKILQYFNCLRTTIFSLFHNFHSTTW